MNKKAFIGSLIFLGMPFIFQLLPLNLFLQELAFWILFLGILAWIYFVEKRTISSIGWKRIGIRTVLGGIGLGALLFILFGATTALIQTLGLQLNQEVAQMFASQPLPILMLVVLRAGVVEEVLYRGYAFERINEITRSKWLGGLIPLGLFTLIHLPWGIGHLLFVFIAGGLFTLIYARKRNLALTVIAHITVDIFAMLVLPILLEGR